MLLILWGIFLLGNILSLSDRVHTLIHGKMVQCPRTRASAIFIVRSSGKRGEVDKYESCTWTWKWASVIFLPHWDEINKIVQVSVQSKTSRSEIHKILKQLIGYLCPNMVFSSAKASDLTQFQILSFLSSRQDMSRSYVEWQSYCGTP